MIIQKQILTLAIVVTIIGVTVGLAHSINAATYMGHAGSAKGGTFGTIASIQGGGDTTHPTWILSGHWATNIINKTNQDFNQTNPPKFDASFTMVLLNGSAKHSHHISNFSLTNVKDENDTLSYTGLATVTLRAGPMKDVPMDIKVFNNNVISIWFDPAKVDRHFGETPIYGTVMSKKGMDYNGLMAPHKGNWTGMGKSNSSSW